MKDPQWYIDRRIVSEEGGYPLSEARWVSVEEYVEYLEKQFDLQTDILDTLLPQEN